DLGHRAGFDAVADGRLEDAMALVTLPMWPFTNELNARGWTLLHVAAHGGFEELCAALCQRKDFLNVDMPDKEFWATPLHLAAGKRRCILRVDAAAGTGVLQKELCVGNRARASNGNHTQL
ncbi:unnamed protein product, partial [Symbiodinium natans]